MGQKAEAIKYAYRYANYAAKLSVNPNADAPKLARTANGDPLDYIMEHALDWVVVKCVSKTIDLGPNNTDTKSNILYTQKPAKRWLTKKNPQF